ncbi:leucine-rich repeat, immunoglobulin-like domain and transmembrane domain-containing protein 3 isoform 2-T2 [Rhinophrynus dorsalis]
MSLFIYLYTATLIIARLEAFCPSQCTCIFHGRSDGTGTRSVLCNDPDMFDIPLNVPVDTVKLRIEKTVIRRIPTEAFYYLADLKYLWMAYNSISSIDSSSFYNLKQLHELRLDGNVISVFPWESLAEMPSLRILDLHNNKITSIPAEAALYLSNITYLDVSSNKLTTLPSDVLDIWPPLTETALRSTGLIPQRVVLGLQDNPWFCDCRISKLMALSKNVDPNVVFLDSLVACSGPESLAGFLFQRVELDQERCLKPSVMTSATKITSPLGSNVLLRCDATGYPTPQLLWSRMNNSAANYTVIQETPADGVRWSILSMNGISYRDAGEYRCKAKNFAGIAEASITVIVVGVVTTTGATQRFGRRTGIEQVSNVQTESREELIKTNAPLLPVKPSSVPTLLPEMTAAPTMPTTSVAFTTVKIPEKKQPKSPPDVKKIAKGQPSQMLNKKNTGKKEKDVTSNVMVNTEQNPVVQDLKVTSEAEDQVTLTWKTLNTTNSSALTVLYSKYGEEDMLRLSTDPSKNRVTIDGLQPRTKYMACVCPKAAQPKKDQCIVFSTDSLTTETNSQL